MNDGLSWHSPSSRLVLSATLDILDEAGYEGLTVEEIRTRAGAAGRALQEGVDLDALVAAALGPVQLLAAPPPTGSLRQDLQALVRPWRFPLTRNESILAALMSAAERRPTLREAVHRALHRPVAEAVGATLSRHHPAPAAERLQTLSWLLQSLVLMRLRTGARAQVDLEQLVDFLITGLGVPAFPESGDSVLLEGPLP